MIGGKLISATSGVGAAPKAIALSIAEFPGVVAYSWNISGFGGLYSTPTTLPTGAGNGIDRIAIRQCRTAGRRA